jgi:ankyrin repeat protein
MSSYRLDNYFLNPAQKAYFPLFSTIGVKHALAAQKAVTWQGRLVNSLIAFIELIPILGAIASIFEIVVVSLLEKKIVNSISYQAPVLSAPGSMQGKKNSSLDLDNEQRVRLISIMQKKYRGDTVEVLEFYEPETLPRAILDEDLESVKKYVELGAGLENILEDDGTNDLFSALHLAAKYDKEGTIITYLLDNNFLDVDIPHPKRKLTPLHYAAHFNGSKIVTLFVERGANVNATDECNQTPLHCLLTGTCSIEEQIASIQLLTANGADANAITETGATPFHYACLTGSVELVEKLIECGVDVEIGDGKGSSALHYAVQENFHRELVNKLVEELNFNFNHANDEDLTPLDLISPKEESIISVLRNAGWRYGHELSLIDI